MSNILQVIVNNRKEHIAKHGHSQGEIIPHERKVPLTSFPRGAFICEIKRKSPSRGNFVSSIDHKEDWATSLAKKYIEQGVETVSVLTEQSYFNGSLHDLMTIKTTYPSLCVLRKDFLFDEEDIEVSYRVGADAILLMASILSDVQLSTLYQKAMQLGLGILVEVHTEEEANRVLSCIEPHVLGINCRDLKTFVLDKLTPLRIIKHIKQRKKINNIAHYVYESAIFHASDVQIACESGCDTMLIGEAAVTHTHKIAQWKQTSKNNQKTTSSPIAFWNDILNKTSKISPLVKICGLCREDDVLAAVDYGTDILGFILASSSKRKTTPEFIKNLREKNSIPQTILAVGVVVGIPTQEHIALIEAGYLNALQIHIPLTNDHDISDMPWNIPIHIPWYRAVQLKDINSVQLTHVTGSPRTLLDAYSEHAFGGTGKRIDDEILALAKKQIPLWVAGGLTPETVQEVIEKYTPELVDIASGIEDAPGIKNHIRMKTFINLVKSM